MAIRRKNRSPWNWLRFNFFLFVVLRIFFVLLSSFCGRRPSLARKIRGAKMLYWFYDHVIWRRMYDISFRIWSYHILPKKCLQSKILNSNKISKPMGKNRTWKFPLSPCVPCDHWVPQDPLLWNRNGKYPFSRVVVRSKFNVYKACDMELILCYVCILTFNLIELFKALS